jgi:hypothetical protein
MTDRELLKQAMKALERCQNVLGNMARENEGAIFFRWPIHHEPLRSDARGLLPVVDRTITAIAEALKDTPDAP